MYNVLRQFALPPPSPSQKQWPPKQVRRPRNGRGTTRQTAIIATQCRSWHQLRLECLHCGMSQREQKWHCCVHHFRLGSSFHKYTDACQQNMRTNGNASSPSGTLHKPRNILVRDTKSNAPMPSMTRIDCIVCATHSHPARVEGVLKRSGGGLHYL